MKDVNERQFSECLFDFSNRMTNGTIMIMHALFFFPRTPSELFDKLVLLSKIKTPNEKI